MTNDGARAATGPTLFLHAGMPKTGTTAIQSYCQKNPRPLAAAGLAYPGLVNGNHGGLFEALFAETPWRQGSTRQQLVEGRDALMSGLDDFLARRRREGLDVLMSGEALSVFKAPSLERLKAFAERHYDNIVVIVLVRPPQALARSATQQNIKSGRSFQQFVESPPTPALRARLRPMIRVFGKENVRVGLYHKSALVEGDSLQTLFHIMGGDRSALADARAPRVNTSISLTAAKLLSIFNAAVQHRSPPQDLPAPVMERLTHPFIDSLHEGFTAPIGVHNERAALLGTTMTRVPGPKYQLPREIAELVHTASRLHVGWLDKAFGIDLDRYDDPVDESLGLADMTVFAEEEIEAITQTLDPVIANPKKHLGHHLRLHNHRSGDIVRRSLKRLGARA